ncbi:hypothetical protein BDB00DRAFT_833182 [Zychaea mexicana]|uniref:uncharacterized protein n=1 Tax=Zychaea mexicana TaxID=64656 RepID=UPI0022FEF417|nr:uncharacterized protein BDB00DRAFT_833182 [Zychaea mexicana]KAI9491337.1 hypothetical protein BDB00DRAFT_833182 [Zychaea mexicana]
MFERQSAYDKKKVSKGKLSVPESKTPFIMIGLVHLGAANSFVKFFLYSPPQPCSGGCRDTSRCWPSATDACLSRMPSTKLNGSIPIDHFLKEALQILRHASVSVTAPDNADVTDHDNYSNDDDDDYDDRPRNNSDKDQQAVTWKLNLSPTTMTLDTNIQTITGLEKVLEQLSLNIQPRPPPLKQPPLISSHEYQMPDYLHSIATALYLSSVFPLPKADIFRQFNSMQLMRQCIQAFVMCDGAIFFHIPRLLAETELVLTHPAASKEHPIETLLVLSICSLMIRHVMMHKQGPPQIAAGLMHAYYAHARLLLQDLFDTCHISVVQALFMLSVYPQGHVDMFSPSRTRSPLFSVALRLALSMDLHRIDLHNDDDDDNNNNNTDENENTAGSEEKEKLRRFSWMLLCADYFADWNGSGTAGRINVADWHVNFPQPLPDEQQAAKRVEYLALYSRVVMIRKMHLFRSAYSIVHRSPKGRESSTDEMLFEKYMNTPAPFQLKQDLMDSSTKTWSRSDLEPLLLHTLYYDTLISTHVPFLPKRYLQTLERERSIRESHVKDIFDRISQSSAPASQPSSSRLPDYASFSKGSDLYSNRRSLSNGGGDGDLSASLLSATDAEFHTVVGCLDAASHLTLVLELLLVVDPIGCYHSPVYGALTTAHVYHMLETNSQDADVVNVCRINLVRTFRIIQQARLIHADAVVLYLQRILPQWMAISTDEPTLRLQQQACGTMQTLRERAKSKGASIHNSSPADDSLQVVKTEST